MRSKIKLIINLIFFLFSLYTLTQCINTFNASAAENYCVRIGENVNGTVTEKQISDTIKLSDGSVYGEASDYNYYLPGYTLKSVITTYELLESGNGYYIYKIDSDGYFNLVYDIAKYSITFQYYDINGDTAVYSQVLNYKDMPSAPDVPSDMPYGTFLSWDSAITEVNASKHYKAIYSYKTYTVNYVANGEVIKTMLVNHYDKTVLSYEPSLEKYYSFKGWATETNGKRITEININNDITLYAITSYDDRTFLERAVDWFTGLMALVKIAVIFIIVVCALVVVLIFIGLFRSAFGRK